MRIVFFGTPPFAAGVLRHLLQSEQHKVVAVVSRPDAPSGRGRTLKPTIVKETAQRYGEAVPVLQPARASTPEVVAELKKYDADVFLVVAYGEILKKEILDIPTKGCFNIHASLLPEYRGAAPIQRALMDGCHRTGITFMRMSTGMDSGDIVLQRTCLISENENAQELKEKLLLIALEATDVALKQIEDGSVVFQQQQHAEATYAPKIAPEDLILNEIDDIWCIHNRVRALSPEPGAYFLIQLRDEKKRLKVLRTHIDESLCDSVYRWKSSPKGELMLSTAEGSLVFDQVQLEGKSLLSSKDFLRGSPLDTILFL